MRLAIVLNARPDPVPAAGWDAEVAAGQRPLGERLGQLPQIGHDRRRRCGHDPADSAEPGRVDMRRRAAVV
jgi:hypothetical protein